MARPRIPSSRLSHLSVRDDGGGDADDDDAWALDSDEEQPQFTLATHRQQLQPSRPMSSQRMPSRTSSTSSTSGAAGSPPSTSSSSNATTRKHAPPARPHPFPIPSRDQQPPSRTTSNSFSSSWTMIDPAAPTKHSLSSSSGVVPLAGSPPTDVGSTAAEAVLKASLRGGGQMSPTLANQSNNGRPSTNQTSSTGHASGTESPKWDSGVSLSRKRDPEVQHFLGAIRPDLPAVVRDPFAALDALAADDSESSTTPHTPAAATPTTSVRQQRDHVQNLGRGFDDLQHGRSPLVSPTSSPLPPSATATPRPNKSTPKQRQASHFDPITMGGDGLIMGSGAFGSSSTSLDQAGATDSATAYHNDEDDQHSFASSSAVPQGHPSPALSAVPPLSRQKSVRTRRRWREFLRCLNAGDLSSSAGDSSGAVDLAKLRELSWNGIPAELRPIVWPLLLGYVPCHSSMRTATLARKRAEYCKAVTLAFGFDVFAKGQLDGEQSESKPSVLAEHESRPSTPTASAKSKDTSKDKSHGAADPDSGRRTPVSVSMSNRSGPEEKIWHQISIDVPRTNPGLPLWQRKGAQRALERLLYVWALRHHATGYVQGMSDLATPFFEVFLSNYLRACPDVLANGEGSSGIGLAGEELFLPSTTALPRGMDSQQFDPAYLPLSARIAIEADTFWCLSSLLDGIQENYVFAQPGIVRQVRRMEELVARIDAPLHAHLKAEGVEYIQFAFRWMNCLLMREMSVKNVVRLWDTYLAEGPDAFSDFHLYVCSVFLCKWSEQLKDMDFQGCIMFLQSLPTQGWSDKDAELLLSEAFVFKNLFGQTKHLND